METEGSLPCSSQPHALSARHVILLVQSGFYHFGFLIKSLPHAPPIQSSWFDHPDYREEYRYSSSSLWIYLHFLATFPLLYPNTILTTLFPNTIIRVWLNVRNRILYPYNIGIKMKGILWTRLFNALRNSVITLDVMKLGVNCIIYPIKTNDSTFVCSM